ncbi:hypothetical protein [Piscinibacter defluvii]|uniref:hypothetical protein n=1 Tax=Piscinibacter defluvii TaxID=1796922 RepID=UPI000FDE8721|nr:hypothetical protein [Piscinibacter defluvii]
MTTILSNALPDLVATIATALRGEGFAVQADELTAARIERWTFDFSANAGYLYLVQHCPVQPGETPAARTLPFMGEEWFNIDLRASGEVFGIELLSHEQVFHQLRSYETGHQ